MFENRLTFRGQQYNSTDHKIASKPANSSFFQPKLTINQPNDSFEQEADAMADRVMRMTDSRSVQNSFFKSAGNPIQRKCQACGEEDKHVHRKESNGGEFAGHQAVEGYINNLDSGGQPLSQASRDFFEPKFGRDFSGVKIHTGQVAAKSAESINALAYTSGNNIVFNSGQYSPESDTGKRLMAHELTHVVQQGGGDNKQVQRKIAVPSGRKLDTGEINATRTGDVYTTDKVVKTSVYYEIFTAMLASPRLFKLDGKTDEEVYQNLKKHIDARQGIIDFASKKKYTFAAGADMKMNPKYWYEKDGNWNVKKGQNTLEAINDLNKTPGEYAIACEAATKLTMLGGGKSLLKDDASSDPKDWVPGDWGYIKNTNGQSNQTPGLEGENLIYVGKDQFWGHFNPGNTYDTLDGWMKEVNSFGGNKGTAELQTQRTYTTAGLGK